MIFLRRKNRRNGTTANGDAPSETARARLRAIGEEAGSSFTPDDREDVEARLRGMFYGARREASDATE